MRRVVDVRWIVRIAVVALLAVVVMRLRERQADVAATAGDLHVDRQGIVQTEGYVGDLDTRIDQAAEDARDLDRQVTAFEARHPDGIPVAERADYERVLTRRNEVVAEHNDLVARRRTVLEEYDHRVARHNDHVADANALAEESTPWRVVQNLWESIVGSTSQ